MQHVVTCQHSLKNETSYHSTLSQIANFVLVLLSHISNELRDFVFDVIRQILNNPFVDGSKQRSQVQTTLLKLSLIAIYNNY